MPLASSALGRAKSGGASDATLTTSDITTNDVSITKHGFAPKAPNDATKFLNGVGAYSTPAGGGDVAGPVAAADGQLALFSGATGKILKTSTIKDIGSGVLQGVNRITDVAGNSSDYIDSVGPHWSDNNGAGFGLTINIQGLSANRAPAAPDSNGTIVVASAAGSTVGAAGAATVLPAIPLGYITFILPSGAPAKIPYYNT